MESYNYGNKNISKLSTTARNLFYIIESFGRFHNINDAVSTWMLESPVKKN